MIRLLPEQIAALEAQYERRMVDRIVQHIAVEHDDIVAGFPEPLLREMVENGIARARRHGLTWESNLTAFVALMFTVAPNFDEQPAIQRVMSNERLPADERFGLLARLRGRHWRDARSRYDERAWFPELYEDPPAVPAFRIRIVR
jgi:hypothetical protein